MSFLTNRWPQKLAALLLAVLVWFVIEQNRQSTTQRSFEIPVVIEGAENETVSGAPAEVKVDVSGESDFVNRLAPENFQAILDVKGISGAYEERINVVLPQGVRLVSVDPVTAAGTVETLSSKVVPVEVALLGAMPKDALLDALPQPAEVTVRGRSSTLEGVTKAIALVSVQAEEGAVLLYPADVENRPVSGPALEPATARVRLQASPILFTKSLPVTILPLELDGLAVAEMEPSSPNLTVVGPEETLRDLETLPARLDLTDVVRSETGVLVAGEYTVAVEPDLPEGVSALDSITALVTLALGEPPAEPVTNSPDDTNAAEVDVVPQATEESRGEDDTTDTPVRGPGPAQESDPSN